MTAYVTKLPGVTRVPPGEPLPLPWPESEYARLDDFFDVAEVGYQEQPCIVVDMYGRIILWYMPDIIHPNRVVLSSELLRLTS